VKPAAASRKGAAVPPGTAGAAATDTTSPADQAGTTSDNKPIRSVGPTFIPPR
jgi:hypothetical protein